MLLTEKLNHLFESWENEINGYKGVFVRDGIINEQEWLNTEPKILFVTKEPNQFGHQISGDFRDDWQNKYSKYPFAYRIAEWSYGLINDFPIFNAINKNQQYYQETLQRISFLNIKKSGGVGTSNGGEICSHYDQNESFLKRQIEIIDPTIIILCLSWNSHICSKLFEDAKWQDSGYNIRVAKHGKAKIIDFYHPSARNAPPASYSLLENVYKSAVFRNL